MKISRPPVDLLGIPVINCTTAEFIDAFCSALEQPHAKRPVFVSYLNAWCSNVAASDKAYAEILRGAEAVYADGQAIVWASRLLGTPLPERINAADFAVEFCREAAARGLSLYLLGSADGVAARAAQAWQRQVPALRVSGAEGGYMDGNDQQVIERINACAPDCLLVGMGVPLQEKWVWQHLDQLNVRGVWCIGAMFEFHGKYRARAPVWMRRAGLEWLFRLLLEPKRLWRRYIVGNAQFALRVVKAALLKRISNP